MLYFYIYTHLDIEHDSWVGDVKVVGRDVIGVVWYCFLIFISPHFSTANTINYSLFLHRKRNAILVLLSSHPLVPRI